VTRMDSSAISKFCQEVGRLQQQRVHFHEQWISRLQPVNALHYEIISISSYSTSVEFVEWGYNRDKDQVEKIFDLLKNEMGSDRLRAHSQFNTEARLFINF